MFYVGIDVRIVLNHICGTYCCPLCWCMLVVLGELMRQMIGVSGKELVVVYYVTMFV